MYFNIAQVKVEVELTIIAFKFQNGQKYETWVHIKFYIIYYMS